MTDDRMKWMTLAWMLICTTLLAFVAALIMQNLHLRDELAKPVRLSYAEKHEVIKAYLADGETRFALRQQIGCTDKEKP